MPDCKQRSSLHCAASKYRRGSALVNTAGTPAASRPPATPKLGSDLRRQLGSAIGPERVTRCPLASAKIVMRAGTMTW